MIEPHRDFHTHKYPFKWPYRGYGKPGKYGKLPQGMEWKINEWTENLYTVPQDDPYALAPGAKFTWTRLRAVGGRTLVWGRESGRFGPLDFKPRRLQDGFGQDWPITYEELAPYYDKVEALIGVAGGGEDVYNSPANRSEEHTSELQSPCNLVCRLLLEKKTTPASRPPTYHDNLPPHTSRPT